MAPVKQVKNVKKGRISSGFHQSSVAEVSQDGTVTFHKRGNAIVQAKGLEEKLAEMYRICV